MRFGLFSTQKLLIQCLLVKVLGDQVGSSAVKNGDWREVWIARGIDALVVDRFGVVLKDVFGIEKFFGCDTFGTGLVLEDDFLQLFQWEILELVLDSNTIIHLFVINYILSIVMPTLFIISKFITISSVFYKRFMSSNQPFYNPNEFIIHSHKFHSHPMNQITIKINIKVKQNLSLC